MVNNSEAVWIEVIIKYNSNYVLCLCDFVLPFLNNIKNNNLLEQYYFIKNVEGLPLIHLRLKSYDSVKLTNTIITSDAFFKSGELVDSSYGFVRITKYKPHIDRYGGPEGMKIAEKFFEISSEVVLRNYVLNYNSLDKNLLITSAIFLHIGFIKAAQLDTDDAIMLLDFNINNWIGHIITEKQLIDGKKWLKAEITVEIEKLKAFFEDFYQEHLKEINNIILNICDPHKFENQTYQLYKYWTVNINKSNKILKQLMSADKLNIPQQILFNNIYKKLHENNKIWFYYDSYFHMTNNRLGLRPRDESFIYYMIKRVFEKK